MWSFECGCGAKELGLEPESIGSPLATHTVDPANVIAASTVIAIFVTITDLSELPNRSSIRRIGGLRMRANVMAVSFGLWGTFTRGPRATLLGVEAAETGRKWRPPSLISCRKPHAPPPRYRI